MGSMPRRARQPIPSAVPHGRRVVAGCAVLLVVVQLLLAQLTLVLAVAFAVTGWVSRWRPWWLAGPTVVGLAWAVAVGPAGAVSGFAAGAAQLLGYLGRAHVLAPARGQAPGPFAGAAEWLPRQLPIALITGAAQAALIDWLSRGFGRGRLPGPSGPSGLSGLSGAADPAWPAAGRPSWLPGLSLAAGRPRRPGLIAAVRTALGSGQIRSGAVVTRAGCALGVDPERGAVVQLRWPEIAGGLLVAGADGQDVTVTSLQIAHAALRRRKPLIVIDLGLDAAVGRALTSACAATGVPLRHETAGAELEPVITERSAALIPAGSAELAARACAAVAALAARLRRIGVDGDGLIWVAGGERLPAPAAAELIGSGRTAGMPVLISTVAPTAASYLAGLAGAVLAHRLADPALATALAASIVRLGGVPGPRAPAGLVAFDGARPAPGLPAAAGPAETTWADERADPGQVAGARGLAGRPEAGLLARPEYQWPAEPGGYGDPAGLAGALLSLRAGEFALAVGGPRRRVVERGRLVPARLPRPAAAGQPGGRRRLRYGPA